MDAENNSRVSDYDKGVEAMKSEDYDTAIRNFQECMRKLSSQGLGLNSDLFPKCLQNISSCYNEKDDMENALSFKKFEKLYYETVLLHNGVDGLIIRVNENVECEEEEEQSSRDRGDGSSEASVDSTSAGLSSLSDTNITQSENESSQNQNVKRASEYEQLARLCLQQECVDLALEYSGKATLMYRHEFGDDHDETKKSFELFTSIYAEAGRKQYSDSMDLLKLDVPNNLDLLSSTSTEETSLRHRRNINQKDENEATKSLKRTRSILKKGSIDGRANNDLPTPETPTRRVTFADPLPQMVRLREDDETDDSTTNLLLFFLVVLLIVLFSLLISAIVCHMHPTMLACADFRRELTYYYHRLRHFYSTYLKK